MKYAFILLLAAIATIVVWPNKDDQTVARKKILVVVSNIGETEGINGASFFNSVTNAYHIFKNKGYEVDFLSPAGKQAPVLGCENQEGMTDLFLGLKNSLSPSKVKPENYAAIIFPEGYGQLRDVKDDAEISKLTLAIYESGGIIGTIGNGAACLADLKLKNGKYLVEGKDITCFPGNLDPKLAPVYESSGCFLTALPVAAGDEPKLPALCIPDTSLTARCQMNVMDQLQRRNANVKPFTYGTMNHFKQKEYPVVRDKEDRIFSVAFDGYAGLLCTEIAARLLVDN